jgi:hypothetical protein
MKRLFGLVVLALVLSAVRASGQAQAFSTIWLGASPCTILSGSGSPETVVTAAICSSFYRTDTGDRYLKTSGSGNTGWSLLPRVDAANTFSVSNAFNAGWTGTTGSLSSTLHVGGNFDVNTSKFTVNASNGNTADAGTLDTTGDFRVNTNKFTVTAVSGNTAAAGTLDSAGDFRVNTTKFTVAAATGNSAVAGTLGITGDTTFGANAGTSSYVSQTTGWRIDNTGAADVRYLFTNELRSLIFTAEQESVLAGSERITKSYSTISQTFTCPALSSTSTLWVFDSKTFANAAIFVSGDQVLIHALSRTALGGFTISDCVGAVTSYADGTGGNDGQQSWTFTRNASTNGGSMASSTTVAINQLVQDMGVSGNGYVESVADDGSNNTNAPYVQTVTWATAPITSNLTTRCRFGNLKGITSVGEYGLLCGNFGGNAYVRLSDTNAEIKGIPVTLLDGSTVTVKLDPTVPSIALGNPVPTGVSTNDGIWMGKNGSVYTFRAGNPSGTHLVIDSGSGVRMGNGGTDVFTVDTSGNLFLAGSLTMSTGGTFHTVSATNITTGIGIWMDYNTGFRVGDPAANYVRFDGTNIIIHSANLIIDNTGLRLNVTTSGSSLQRYGWTYANGTGYVEGYEDPLGQGIIMYVDKGASTKSPTINIHSSNGGTVASANFDGNSGSIALGNDVSIAGTLGIGSTTHGGNWIMTDLTFYVDEASGNNAALYHINTTGTAWLPIIGHDQTNQTILYLNSATMRLANRGGGGCGGCSIQAWWEIVDDVLGRHVWIPLYWP